jgi:NAD(P)-dependent dehydrogenase (short-subunit alcohol dehydrogenase family)
MKLKDKKVLITGSSSGIGQSTAIEFAKKGAVVFINYRKNDEGAKETLREVEKYSSGEIFKADLENIEDVKNMIGDIVEKYGNIDILVNNASDYLPGDFEDLDLWEKSFKNVLMSTVHTTTEFLKQTNGNRKVLNTSSIYGSLEKSTVISPYYSSMKAAVSNLTSTLAKRYADDGVMVNAVALGWTFTQNVEAKMPKERQEKITKRLAIGRFVQTKEIAHTFIYLAENDAINGQIITVDG